MSFSGYIVIYFATHAPLMYPNIYSLFRKKTATQKLLPERQSKRNFISSRARTHTSTTSSMTMSLPRRLQLKPRLRRMHLASTKCSSRTMTRMTSRKTANISNSTRSRRLVLTPTRSSTASQLLHSSSAGESHTTTSPSAMPAQASAREASLTEVICEDNGSPAVNDLNLKINLIIVKL